MKFLIDDVLVGQVTIHALKGFSSTELVLIVCAVMIVLLSFTAIILALEKNLHAKVREHFSYRLRDQLIQQIYRLNIYKRQQEHSGELTMRLLSDSQLVSRLLCKTLPKTIKDFGVALFIVGVTFTIDIRIGGLCLLLATGLGFITLRFGPKLAAAARQKRLQEGDVAAITQESVTGIEHIQAMSLEEKSRQKFLAKTSASLHAGVEEVRVAVQMERAAQIFSALAIGLTAAIGGLLVVKSEMTLGTLTVCIAYITQLMKPMEKLNEVAATISRGLARAQRLNKLMDDAADSSDTNNLDVAPALKEISVNKVRFSYPGMTVNTLEEFSHTFAVGQCSVLVGPSGSGKSTVLRLLIKLLHPNQGELKINQIPYECVDGSSLRAQFAVLMQNAHLFSGSIRSVLCELNDEVTEHEIEQVLEQVHLLELIDELPDGVDTQLDEQGGRISGGQRSRLLLARAILSKRPAILLDEPFANIDDNSKQIIMQTLNELKVNHMLVIVTHDPVLLRMADQVIDISADGLSAIA